MNPTTHPAAKGASIGGTPRARPEPRAQLDDGPHVERGHQTGRDAEQRIHHGFAGVGERRQCGHAKERRIAEEPSRRDDRGCRREHDRAEHRAVPRRDDLFDDEEHTRDRRVEGGRNPGSGANRRDEPPRALRQPEHASERRRHASAHEERRILGPERRACADRETARGELAGNGPRGNVAVGDIERRFRLHDAAAPRFGQGMPDQQAGGERSHDQATGPAGHGRPGPVAGSPRHEIDRRVKADDESPATRPIRTDSSRKRWVSPNVRDANRVDGAGRHERLPEANFCKTRSSGRARELAGHAVTTRRASGLDERKVQTGILAPQIGLPRPATRRPACARSGLSAEAVARAGREPVARETDERFRPARPLPLTRAAAAWDRATSAAIARSRRSIDARSSGSAPHGLRGGGDGRRA